MTLQKRRTPRMSAALVRLALLPGLILVSGCDVTAPDLESSLSSLQDVVFLTQRGDLESHPQALFSGNVALDSRGCIRLSNPAPENSTVVWPAGYSIAFDGAQSVVHDPDGGEVGRLGGAFQLGGGHTSNLAGVLAPAFEPETVGAQCPGSFWVVSP